MREKGGGGLGSGDPVGLSGEVLVDVLKAPGPPSLLHLASRGELGFGGLRRLSCF